MKIELKHLAGYLPYGLKGISIEENLGFEIVKGFSTYGKNNTISLITNVDDIDLELFKPILRPLSDLTKEIEVNEEKFVPLLEICKFLKLDFSNYNILENSIDLTLNDKLKTKARFWFSNYKGTGFYCSKMNKLMYKDILGAIEKLYEWHFDVFGLIEKELAFDINTL